MHMSMNTGGNGGTSKMTSVSTITRYYITNLTQYY